MANHLFETYKNSLMPHAHHIYATPSDMAMDTVCAYPPYHNAFPHWKCVLRCCSNCPCIDLSGQESDRHHSKITPSINFHIYHLIARCTVHGGLPLHERNIFSFYLQDPATFLPAKYTQQKTACYDGDINL